MTVHKNCLTDAGLVSIDDVKRHDSVQIIMNFYFSKLMHIGLSKRIYKLEKEENATGPFLRERVENNIGIYTPFSATEFQNSKLS